MLTPQEQLLVLSSRLFRGIPAERLPSLLNWLQARRAHYEEGGLILRQGDEVAEVGLVLSGHGMSIRQDGAGPPLIISLIRPGGFTGILLAASRERKSPVSVMAQEPLELLLLPIGGLLSPRKEQREEYGVFLGNYLDSIAEQALSLNARIECLLRRSVRQKVVSYLLQEASEQGSPCISLSLDRNAMAEYLNVERSALSRELSRMKKDGLIQYRKNRFCLSDALLDPALSN